ncbi:hypothetical protein Ddye_008173 [Dipteronia dyeriana]|uniref:Uncharacterized protein n=1 Tax=Dipteronia dyeriana TaxID=168575 RepID=A0AAE0CL48_9ROSI|nr:hypothetical protein Ddye_008173 [Dipteronia dyeriana]
MRPRKSQDKEKFNGKKLIPERGINLTELDVTLIPGMVWARGWDNFVQRPIKFFPLIIKEFYSGVIEYNYNFWSPVLVRGKAVRINSRDINMHFRITLPDDIVAMFKGVPELDIFTRMNIDLANSLVIRSMEFWNSRSNLIKQKNLLIELAFWHIFIHTFYGRTDIALQ